MPDGPTAGSDFIDIGIPEDYERPDAVSSCFDASPGFLDRMGC